MKELHTYKYYGPVKNQFGEFLADRIRNEHDNGSKAISPAKAKSNIAFNWKKKWI